MTVFEPFSQKHLLQKNIGLIRDTIEEDRYITLRSILTALNSGVQTINIILRKHLKVHKICFWY